MEIKQENQGVEKPKMRQIIIETNGLDVHVVKAEVTSVIEFNAILDMVYRFLNDPEKVKGILTEPIKKETTNTATPPVEDPDN